jgi:Family of unknown function (DUF5677)
VTEKQFADPKILVLALLCRTISNFEGIIALAKLGLIVEARTLTRCCYESLFFIGGLIEKGDEFVSAMYQDELASIRSRANFLLETQWQENNETLEKFGKGLRERLEEMKKRWPKAKFLNPKEAAKSGVIVDAYLLYSQFSADAAHPSLRALKRHLVRHEENGEPLLGLNVKPVIKETEIADTMNLACNAFNWCVRRHEPDTWQHGATLYASDRTLHF